VVLSIVQTGWCSTHVQILPLSLLLTVNCTLDVAVLVEGLPVGLIGTQVKSRHYLVRLYVTLSKWFVEILCVKHFSQE
jgi:hypothetical protein